MSLPHHAVATVEQQPAQVRYGGYRWEFFRPSISPFYTDQYRCSICYLVLRDPHKCPNNHLFCKSCIYSWIISDNRCSLSCPVCRDDGPFINDSKVKSELDNHIVSCGSPKCSWSGKLSDYQTHHHGAEEAVERHVPDLSVTVDAERLRKDSGDGFINEDRIVAMMSIIYADIEQRRRRIESVQMTNDHFTQDQLGDIQLLHDRLLSLRRNIDSFFGQSAETSPYWARISNMTSRAQSNSSVSSGGLSDTEMSEDLQTMEPMQIYHSDGSEDQINFFNHQSPSISSELEFSEESNAQQDESESIQALVDELGIDPPETVQANPPVERRVPQEEVPVTHRTNSNEASRLRYDYLSRRFNLPRERFNFQRGTDSTDIKRRKMN